MNTFAFVVFCVTVASASASHLGYGAVLTHSAHLVHPAAHISSGSVGVSADGAVIAGPSGSVRTNNGILGHGASAQLSGPAGDVATHDGLARLAGPAGHDALVGHVAHAAPVAYAAHAAPVAYAAHHGYVAAAPIAHHTAVVAPSAHTTIVGARSHASIVAPAVHHGYVAGPVVHHAGVYSAAPAVAATWGHHGVVAHGLNAAW